MKTFILLFFTLALGLQLQADSEWKLIREEEDIQVYSHYSPNTVVKTVKGVVIISASLNKVLKVFEDIRKCPSWMYRCRSAETLQQLNIVERIDYLIIDLPWPAWDRDVIIHSLFQQDKNTNDVEIKFRTSSKAMACKPGIVRVADMKGAMRFVPQKDGGIQFTYEISVDPRGKIPKWLVNAMAIDFPFYTLKKVRELAEKQ